MKNLKSWQVLTMAAIVMVLGLRMYLSFENPKEQERRENIIHDPVDKATPAIINEQDNQNLEKAQLQSDSLGSNLQKNHEKFNTEFRVEE